MSRLFLLLFLVLLIPSGCKKKTTASKETIIKDQIDTKVDAKKAEVFAGDFLLALESGDTALLGSLLDTKTLMDLSIANTKVSKSYERAFRKEAKKSKFSNQLFFMLIQGIKKGASIHLLRVYEKNDETLAIFRITYPEGGVNYFDLFLKNTSNDKIQIYDFYYYISGDRISDSIGREFVYAAAQTKNSGLKKLVGIESDYVANMKEIIKMTTAIKSGKFEDTIKIYKKLPESVQTRKNVLTLYFAAVSSMDDTEEYQRCVETFRENYPDDPSIDMKLIDYYIYTKEYDKSIQAIDNLEKAIGGDPFLDTVRADTYYTAKDYSKSRELAQKIIDSDLDLEAPYWTMISISLAEKKFEATVTWLKVIEEKFEMEFEFDGIPEYEEFLKSPEYAEWIKKSSDDN